MAQNGVPFVRTRVAMVVHDYELAGSSFAHQSLRLGMKQHRRLIGVADRLERDRSFLAVRTKNDLESPYSAARHGPPLLLLIPFRPHRRQLVFAAIPVCKSW